MDTMASYLPPSLPETNTDMRGTGLLYLSISLAARCQRCYGEDPFWGGEEVGMEGTGTGEEGSQSGHRQESQAGTYDLRQIFT